MFIPIFNLDHALIAQSLFPSSSVLQHPYSHLIALQLPDSIFVNSSFDPDLFYSLFHLPIEKGFITNSEISTIINKLKGAPGSVFPIESIIPQFWLDISFSLNRAILQGWF